MSADQIATLRAITDVTPLLLLTDLLDLSSRFEYPKREQLLDRAAAVWTEVMG